MFRLARIEKRIGIGEVVEDIHWHFEEDGAGLAAQHLAKGRGGVLAQARGLMHRARPLRDRAQQIKLVHLLQRAAIPQAERGRPANDQHRATGEAGIGDAGHAICDARASRQKGDPRPARGLRPAFSRVNRRLLVARIHHADALAHAAVIDTGDMPPAEREDNLYPFTLQYLRHQPAPMYQSHKMSPFRKNAPALF